MFCPNCGTENDEAATTCKKCGFNLKGAAAPKFKGTMLMMNSPQQGLPRPPGAPAPGPAAAPPPAPVPAPATPGPGPGGGGRQMLKGTMLGVAPPAMGGHAPPPAAHQPPPAGPQGGFGMAPTPAQPFNAQQPPGAPHAPAQGAPPGVNPLGGTMVADPAGMGFNPYGGGGYGAPPQQQQPPGPPPAHGGPPPGGYTPPPGGGYGAPAPANPGFPPPGGGFPPPGGGYGAPHGQPPGQSSGGFGPPPGQGGFNPPAQQGGYGAPQHGAPQHGAPQHGGYGAPQQGYGGPQQGYGSPQAYGGPNPGGMPPGGAPIVAASAGGRPLGKTRNPVMTLVFSSLCFVYALIQIWQMANELKAFRGKDDINPIFFFIPILNIIQIWNLAPKLLEAKQMAGVPNATVQHPVLYLFFGIYFWPADLNEIWQAAGGGQAR